MKNIVLTGFMGAGKTTVGKILAEKTGLKIIDTDEKIEKDAGMKISKIFSKYGEPYFRNLERKAVKEVSELKGYIIVTGGGVVLKNENMDNLKRNGVVIYLHADPEVIYDRIKSETHRPLLQVEDPLAKIKEMLDQRAPYYANKDHKIDTSNMSVEKVVDSIMEIMEDE